MKGMGEIRARVRLENSGDRALCEAGKIAAREVRVQEIDAIVDTGAVMMLLPQELVEALGLKKLDRVTVGLADETRVTMDTAGIMLLTYVGRCMPTDCLVGPPGCEPLIGQLIMERLDLIADPARRTLTPRPESPYRATLKLKELAAV